MTRIIIPGTLPGLNEYIDAERSNKYAAARLKKNAQELIVRHIRYQASVAYAAPVVVAIRWMEPNRKRDKDNIAFAKKFILDALREAGTIGGDGWCHIEGFQDHFGVVGEGDDPFIEVQVIPLDEYYDLPA